MNKYNSNSKIIKGNTHKLLNPTEKLKCGNDRKVNWQEQLMKSRR